MPSPESAIAPMALSIREACEASRLGRTRIYELVNQGQLKSVKLGRRRLIHADSLRALIAEGC